MNEIFLLLFSLVMGFLLGSLFFGGLWWTVRKGLSSQKSTLWFLASLWLRMIITSIGFYFSAAGDWNRLLMCLLGFIMARFVVIRMAQSLPKPVYPAQGDTHAP